MKSIFYDIESLNNVFTLCAFHREDNIQEIYILLDDEQLYQQWQADPQNVQDQVFLPRIRQDNKSFDGICRYYDLRTFEANVRLAKLFGLSAGTDLVNSTKPFYSNNPNQSTHDDPFMGYFRPICDTDKDFDPKIHPYLFGYNSSNYDLTILAYYFTLAWQTNNAADKMASPPSNVQSDSDLNQNVATNVPTFTGLNWHAACPLTAKALRRFNNVLFEPANIDQMPRVLAYKDGKQPRRSQIEDASDFDDYDFKNQAWLIRRNFLTSGRHIDVSRLNEKMFKVGLKRLLAMLGHQIVESDKLSDGNDQIRSLSELAELISYNVSDTVALSYLFDHPAYSSQFDLKNKMLKQYPEMLYSQDPVTKKPNISTETVRKDRLRADSTSAQFANLSLAPYGPLGDIEAVSFLYPHPIIAKEIGVEPVNVLEETKKFLHESFPLDTPHHREIRQMFEPIYLYYKDIEGKNFNPKLAPADSGKECFDLFKIEKRPNNIPYFHQDGTDTGCFVTFSTGGIHGAEYNKELYDAHMAEYLEQKQRYDRIIEAFPDPLDARLTRSWVDPKTNEEIDLTKMIRSTSTIKVDGKRVPGTIKAMTAHKEQFQHLSEDEQQRGLIERQAAFYKEPPAAPELFVKNGKTGATKLNPKYVKTTAAACVHEDFTSYYPNMLRMMRAFYNADLGDDRYAKFFYAKEDYGAKRSDPKYSKAEQETFNVLRDAMKLILNAASGAGDTNFNSNIQMNNRIISMRIIGQLFTYRIGQAQSYAGAKIGSTNTDGIYSIMDDIDENNRILAEQAKAIHVDIEPEPVFLISKDSNNRMDITPDRSKILAASGGTLACFKDTSPTKALAHPAVLDWALAQYLIYVTDETNPLTLFDPFHREKGLELLTQARDGAFSSKEHTLRMFQNVVASSRGSHRYVFAADQPDFEGLMLPHDGSLPPSIKTLQHYNRVFLVKPETPNSKYLFVAAYRKSASSDDLNVNAQSQAIAISVLRSYGIDLSDRNRKPALTKITGVETSWPALIENRSLFDITDAERDHLLQALDLNIYLDLLEKTYENNWRNIAPDN